MPNLTEEISTVKERRLNQFSTAVLVCCGKSVKFDSLSNVCRTLLGLYSRHDGVPLQSRTDSVRFGTCSSIDIWGEKKNK